MKVHALEVTRLYYTEYDISCTTAAGAAVTATVGLQLQQKYICLLSVFQRNFSFGISQRSNLFAKIALTPQCQYIPFPIFYIHIQHSEAAAVLGQLLDCLLDDCGLN